MIKEQEEQLTVCQYWITERKLTNFQKHKFPKPSQEEVENMTKQITSKEF